MAEPTAIRETAKTASYRTRCPICLTWILPKAGEMIVKVDGKGWSHESCAEEHGLLDDEREAA